MKEFRRPIEPEELEHFGERVLENADGNSEERHREAVEHVMLGFESRLKEFLAAQSGLDLNCQNLPLREVGDKVFAIRKGLDLEDKDYHVKSWNLDHYLGWARHGLGFIDNLKNALEAGGLEKDVLYLAAIGEALAFSGSATYYPGGNAYTYSGYHVPDLMTQELPWNNALRVKGSDACVMRDIILAAQLLWANGKDRVPKWKAEEGKKIKLVSLPVDHPSFLTHLRRKTRIDERITDTEIYAATAILEAWRGLFELQEDEKRERDPNYSNIEYYKNGATLSLDAAKGAIEKEEFDKAAKESQKVFNSRAGKSKYPWRHEVEYLIKEELSGWETWPSRSRLRRFAKVLAPKVMAKRAEVMKGLGKDDAGWLDEEAAAGYIISKVNLLKKAQPVEKSSTG